MVRIKIACNDASKIPGERLFEMKNNLYLIQFKIEPKSGLMDEDGENGDGNDDAGNEDDDEIEENDQDMDLEKRTPSGEKKKLKAILLQVLNQTQLLQIVRS
jgi:hypothetical protein